jgi:colicin import membrane protein
MKFLRNHSLATVASIVMHGVLAFVMFYGLRFGPAPRADGGVVVPIEAVLVDASGVERELERIEANQQAELERQREAEERAREEAEAARLERQREVERLAAVERERNEEQAREVARQEQLRVQREQEEAEAVAREQAAEAERVRLAEAERQRQEEERRQAEAEAQAELQRQEEERRRAEEAERQRQEEEARVARERAAEEERRRREAEEAARLQADLDRAIESELAANRARDSGLYDEYIRNITNQIRQRWIRPPGAPADLECVVHVTQIPSGDVTSISVGSCNGDAAVIRSIEVAVQKASPLPRPGDPSLFQRNLEVTFRPEN